MEILTLIAILIGPFFAVMASQYLDRRRRKNEGKQWIFKTLMRTRATVLNPSHIEALNMIDVEFYGKKKKDKDVVAAWKLYLDNLNDVSTQEDIKLSKRKDLLLDLLYCMAKALSYDLDKEHIKNTSYIPQLHVDIENEQMLLRKGLIAVLDGKISVPIQVREQNTSKS